MGKTINNILKVIILIAFGLLCVILLDLTLLPFSHGFIFENRRIFRSFILCALTLICVYGVCLIFYNSKVIYKILVLALILLNLFLIFFYLLKNTTLFSQFSSVADLREYIKAFKNAPIIYVIIQFFQVVLLPIPSIVVTGAGVILFGPLKCAVLSSFGIILGSIVSFVIGKSLGYKFVTWFLGKDLIDKWLDKIQDKTKLILTFSFLFPFFPDDTLCLLAGVTRIKLREFLPIVFFTRIIAIFISCFTLSNKLIPLNSWWGILILSIILIIGFLTSKYLIKNTSK